MSSNSVNLAVYLLGELFGEVVQNVGKCLLAVGRALPVRQIATETNLPLDKVGKALCVLIQHSMVTFQQHKRGHVEYSISTDEVLSANRYPHYIQLVKSRYGEAAELLVSHLILHGQVTMSSAIQKVAAKLNVVTMTENMERITPSVAFEKFVALAKDKLIRRWPELKMEDGKTDDLVNPVPELIHQKNVYVIPNVNLREIEMQLQKRKSAEANVQVHTSKDADGASIAKRRRIECFTPPMPDDGVYWRIDFDRFHQFLRDRILISSIARVFDKKAAAVVASILRMAESQTDDWAALTNPTSRYDIERHLQHDGEDTEMLDQYLSLLSEDKNGFITKHADSQGGMFCVNYKEAIVNLTVATVENIVQERFGSKCLRLFRLIRQKKYLEQKQIEEMAMFPAKDAKEMTYRMFSEGFIHVKEISRTPDHAPSRTFYLFHIDLTKVVKILVEWGYKFAVNLMVRHEHENSQNKRLSEKEQRVEAIVSSLKLQGNDDDAQLEEVRELITPAEQAQLTKLKHVCKKLELSELQMNETMFVLQMYLRYHNVGK